MGGYAVYDPTDNTAATVSLCTVGQPVDIQSLEKGPDGKLYIGGYMHGASIYDIDKGDVVNSSKIIDQPEGIGFLNGKAYFGTYGSAVIYSYDPSEPFNFIDNGTGNPSLAYDIGNDQDRPFVLTSGDNKLFVGTIPDYGKLGGALTIYDANSTSDNKWTEYSNIVTDQSIVGLAYKDGMLYGGTSIYGGLGINPTQSEAKLFIWDVANGKKVSEISLNIPGLDKPQLIGSLSFGPDGNLYGIADGAIFVMDPSTHEIIRSKVITNVDYSSSSTWRPYYIRWGADGMLYTTIGRNIVVFDPETLAYDTLAGGVSLMTLGDDGNIYYASGSELMKLPLIKNANRLSSVVISVTKSTICKNRMCNVTISAKMSDGTNADLSNAAIEYFTDNPNVISINNNEIIGNNLGSAQIWANVTLAGKIIPSNKITITVSNGNLN